MNRLRSNRKTGSFQLPSNRYVALTASALQKPVIAIYGEYDALAGLSQNAEASFSPLIEGAAGHGCGHNLIGAGAAAAAVAVSKWMEAGKIKGTLRYYGTPTEEAIGGKALHARSGAI